jgi:hypothetical protein
VLPADEARRGGGVEHRLQGAEEAADVQRAARLGVDAELGPGGYLEELVKRAESAGQHDERVCLIGHRGLALVHGLDYLQAGEAAVGELLVPERAGDDPVHLSARRQGGVRDDAHQPHVAATVDKPDAPFGEQGSQFSRGSGVDRVEARAGPAVDRDRADPPHYWPSRFFASA